jgi:hypothetical protein
VIDLNRASPSALSSEAAHGRALRIAAFLSELGDEDDGVLLAVDFNLTDY